MVSLVDLNGLRWCARDSYRRIKKRRDQTRFCEELHLEISQLHLSRESIGCPCEPKHALV